MILKYLEPPLGFPPLTPISTCLHQLQYQAHPLYFKTTSFLKITWRKNITLAEIISLLSHIAGRHLLSIKLKGFLTRRFEMNMNDHLKSIFYLADRQMSGKKDRRSDK